MKKRKLRKSEVTYLDASFVSSARTLLYIYAYLLQISCHDCSVGQDLTASAPQAYCEKYFLMWRHDHNEEGTGWHVLKWGLSWRPTSTHVRQCRTFGCFIF